MDFDLFAIISIVAYLTMIKEEKGRECTSVRFIHEAARDRAKLVNINI